MSCSKNFSKIYISRMIKKVTHSAHYVTLCDLLELALFF